MPSRVRAQRTGVETLLRSQRWDDLIPHLLRAGAEVDPALERLRIYMKELCDWNRRVSNLISGNDEKRFIERHLIESLQPAYWLKESGAERWIDFGTGGGLPAIPLAVVGVGKEWTLVESRRTKTLFLRKVIDAMKLTGVTVINDRLENVVADRESLGTFGGFTSRATLTLAPTLEMATQLIGVGGDAFLWKGSGRDAEMDGNQDWQRAWRLEGLLGIGSGVNVVCRFKRKPMRSRETTE